MFICQNSVVSMTSTYTQWLWFHLYKFRCKHHQYPPCCCNSLTVYRFCSFSSWCHLMWNELVTIFFL